MEMIPLFLKKALLENVRIIEDLLKKAFSKKIINIKGDKKDD
jgi:hypothetical protein